MLTPNAPIPLEAGLRPDRPHDLLSWWMTGNAWVEGLEWAFSGVGIDTKAPGAGKCHCVGHSRFALDLFGRSFAPEIDHYCVAVLDSNGNLILRVGQYGNVEDSKPLVPDGGPPNPRSIGGDEVALFHACYLAAHTGYRLFIADQGNQRIVSVRLDYHATERVALKDVKEGS